MIDPPSLPHNDAGHDSGTRGSAERPRGAKRAEVRRGPARADGRLPISDLPRAVAPPCRSVRPRRPPPAVAVLAGRVLVGRRGQPGPEHHRAPPRASPRAARLSAGRPARLAHPREGRRHALRRGRARAPAGPLPRRPPRPAALLASRATRAPARARAAACPGPRRDRAPVHLLRVPGEAVLDRRGGRAPAPRPDPRGAPGRPRSGAGAPARPRRADRAVALLSGHPRRGRHPRRPRPDGAPRA